MNICAVTASCLTSQQPIHPPPKPPINPTPANPAHPYPPLKAPKTASWTSSISLHCRNHRLAEALLQFTHMRLAGVDPNHITFVTLLSACAHSRSSHLLSSLPLGMALHGYAIKLGLDSHNVMVAAAIIDMYSKFGLMGLARLCFNHLGITNKVCWNTIIDGYMRNGEFEDAIQVFDEMPDRDVVSWTALIGGFVRKGHFEEALLWFQDMQLSGVEPDYVTLISVLSAVANLGTLSLGRWLHRYIVSRREFRMNIRVNNSLVDMYCRCGCIELAHQVFKSMPKKSLVSWNSIITGLAMNGHAKEALDYFNLMQENGFKPDGFSFTGALTACSHAGLVDKGQELFEVMKRVHQISPRIQHYGCLVDLYSRAGRLNDALQIIRTMPMKPNEVLLGSLLAACRTFGEIKLAERMMEYIYNLDHLGDSNHVMLSNIYATVGSWDGASNVRKKMKALGIQKQPGFSYIEIDCVSHEFMAGDQSHKDTERICELLELLSLEIREFGDVHEGTSDEQYEYD